MTTNTQARRRVRASEFAKRLGIKQRWFDELVRRGVIPPGHKDPGGNLRFWLDSVVDETVDRMCGGGDQQVDTKAA